MRSPWSEPASPMPSNNSPRPATSWTDSSGSVPETERLLRRSGGVCSGGRGGIGVLEREPAVGVRRDRVEEVVEVEECLPGRFAGSGGEPVDDQLFEVRDAFGFPD